MRWARRAAGTSSTGPATATSPRASWRAPRRRATERSWSRSTRGCSAGARATSSTHTCRSSKAKGVANYFSDPVFRAALERPPEEDLEPALGHWAYQFSNPAVTWADLEWLRDETELPILLKGILHADDARRALQAGVDGLIVSNHGGRQVDGSIGALDALADVGEAVGGELAVLFDSGVRTGADVFKALALGAEAVCVGRPYVYGPCARRPGGRGTGVAVSARRARPHARPQRLHDAR